MGLKVKTSDGLPAVGEVLAYMHDRSLDVFAPHTPPNPLALYQSNTLSRIPLSKLSWSRKCH